MEDIEDEEIRSEIEQKFHRSKYKRNQKKLQSISDSRKQAQSNQNKHNKGNKGKNNKNNKNKKNNNANNAQGK